MQGHSMGSCRVQEVAQVGACSHKLWNKRPLSDSPTARAPHQGSPHPEIANPLWVRYWNFADPRIGPRRLHSSHGSGVVDEGIPRTKNISIG